MRKRAGSNCPSRDAAGLPRFRTCPARSHTEKQKRKPAPRPMRLGLSRMTSINQKTSPLRSALPANRRDAMAQHEGPPRLSCAPQNGLGAAFADWIAHQTSSPRLQISRLHLSSFSTPFPSSHSVKERHHRHENEGWSPKRRLILLQRSIYGPHNYYQLLIRQRHKTKTKAPPSVVAKSSQIGPNSKPSAAKSIVMKCMDLSHYLSIF